MKQFRKKIIWQIIPVLLIVMVPAFLVGGYFACNEVLRLCLREQQADISHAAHYIEQDMKSYPTQEWLFSYWSENADALQEKMVYDSQEALDALREEFAEKNLGISDTAIGMDELDDLDDESKEMYARICLMEQTLVYDLIKEAYGLKFVYLAKINSENDETFLISGLIEGEKRGNEMSDIFMIGKHVDPGMNYHPVLKEIYLTQKPVDTFEKKSKSGRTGADYNVYVPFFEEDGSTYILCCCKSSDAIMKNVYQGGKVIVFSFLGILFLGILLMAVAFRQVLLRPLYLVQHQIRQYTQDKNADALVQTLSTIKTENEIGQLSSDVSTLAVELTRYTDEVATLSADNERIETELSLARNIQRAALPSIVPEFENHHNFEIAGQMNPAKEVGGDFFDYIKIDEDHLAILIADVSGKGVPAAMFMMVSHICIKNMARTLQDPAEIFREVNDTLMERNELEMFVTAWFGILDLRSGEIKCVNAGHENPAVCRAGEEFSLCKTKHSFVLAGMEGTSYKTETLQLQKGDTLFLYTDGVAEATNAENELYGTDRMIAVLNRVRKENCQTVLDTVKSDIDVFVDTAPQFDDLTMVCLRYL